MKTILLLFCLIAAPVCVSAQRAVDLDAINTLVGTDHASMPSAGRYGKGSEEHGQTLPAVQEPHGQTSWTAQTRATEQKCVAPYYYPDTLWQGFRASHWLTGGCTQDYGSFTLQPMMDSLRLKSTDRAIAFRHDDEEAHPHHYRLRLPAQQLTAEMTARSHAALFRFTAERAGQMHIVVEPNSDEGKAFIAIDTLRNAIVGRNPVHRIYQGWGEEAGFSGWFVVQIERNDVRMGVTDSIAHATLMVDSGEAVMVRAATSFTSLEAAWHNLEAEIPAWDFDATRQQLAAIWQEALQTIKVQGTTPAQENQFYGALYRSLILPRTMSDAMDADSTFAAPAFSRHGETAHYRHESYGDFSMWDIYRAQLPLLQIIEPSRTAHMMQSLVDMYESGGWMPIFPCWNSYTAAMIGDHCASALADAFVKAPGSFDAARAYEGLRKNAFESPSTLQEYRDGMGRRALVSYLKYGFIPLEDEVPDAFHTREQVSRTLEYAYDDFCLAQIAAGLGRTDDFRILKTRADNWRNVINPATGWADARHADGSWLGSSDITQRVDHITEGASIHYSFYVPHDPLALVEVMGGKEAFAAKLDTLFEHNYYWHGNEPCHQIPYLYNIVGQSWKTQRAVHRILHDEYSDTPGGLSGNDDAGQMSAWYVFSALGFYPVCPGTPDYYIGAPSFRHAKIGNLVIEAPLVSDENCYIESVTWNGKPYDLPTLSHEMITGGGTLHFHMSSQPNRGR